MLVRRHLWAGQAHSDRERCIKPAPIRPPRSPITTSGPPLLQAHRRPSAVRPTTLNHLAITSTPVAPCLHAIAPRRILIRPGCCWSLLVPSYHCPLSGLCVDFAIAARLQVPSAPRKRREKLCPELPRTALALLALLLECCLEAGPVTNGKSRLHSGRA